MKRIRFYSVLLVAVTASYAAGQPSTSTPATPPASPVDARAGNLAAAEATEAEDLARALYERLSSGISANVTAPPTATGAVLVVPTARMEAETFMQLNEDMNIMCRVIDRLLASAGLKLHDRSPFVPSDQRRAARGVYLPGFGAVLLVEVDFPLVAPPEDTPEPNVQDQTDTLWSEIKQQMRGQLAPIDGRHDIGRTAPYDELKVESLKRTLLAALQHASNIRHLDPNDQLIALAIHGGRGWVMPTDIFFESDNTSFAVNGPAGQMPSPQLLALRTSKDQVDARASGALTPEQFREKVGILSYQLPSPNRPATPR